MKLRIMEKEINLDQSKILLCGPKNNDELLRDWEYKNGRWSVENGVVTGLHRGNSGGMLYTKTGFDCDVLLDFVAESVLPCCNDLNFNMVLAGLGLRKGRCRNQLYCRAWRLVGKQSRN